MPGNAHISTLWFIMSRAILGISWLKRAFMCYNRSNLRQGDAMAQEGTMFTVKEACEYLRLSRRTLYKYMEEGALPYFLMGPAGRRRLKQGDLDALVTRAEEKGSRE